MRNLAATTILVSVLVGYGPVEASAQENPAPSPVERAQLDLAGIAKVFCSGVFLSGRSVEDIARYTYEPDVDDRQAEISVDTARGIVTARVGELARRAELVGGQGCVTHPVGATKVFFTPVDPVSALPPPDELAWPMGDAEPEDEASGIDTDRVAEALDVVFADTTTFTAAFLVVHDGRIVGERYDFGADRSMPLQSWSMGKSLIATQIGLLIQEGHFDLWDPVPVHEWRAEDDPRSRIRIADLMRMSGGLDFTSAYAPDWEPGFGYPDHGYIYSGATDAFQLSVSRPALHPPGEFGAYKNGDPLVLGLLVKRTVEGEGESYLEWTQRALFDRIGIRSMVLETDPYGNQLLTGYDFGTIRDWARLGLLYLWDGTWQGERLLPEGFADFVSTPAPGWEEPEYGGLFWLNRTGQWSLPEDTYYMSGLGGQNTWIVPSLDLVVVRMGHARGWVRGDAVRMQSTNDALRMIVEAVR